VAFGARPTGRASYPLYVVLIALGAGCQAQSLGSQVVTGQRSPGDANPAGATDALSPSNECPLVLSCLSTIPIAGAPCTLGPPYTCKYGDEPQSPLPDAAMRFLFATRFFCCSCLNSITAELFSTRSDLGLRRFEKRQAGQGRLSPITPRIPRNPRRVIVRRRESNTSVNPDTSGACTDSRALAASFVRSGRFEFGRVGSVWAAGGQEVRRSDVRGGSPCPPRKRRTSDTASVGTTAPIIGSVT
jgi:hypothetical protein